jgi:hypothetical protein
VCRIIASGSCHGVSLVTTRKAVAGDRRERIYPGPGFGQAGLERDRGVPSAACQPVPSAGGAPSESGVPDGIYVAVGSIFPPVIPADPEGRAARVAELTAGAVKVAVYGRVTMSREVLGDLIRLLKMTADQYDAAVALARRPRAREGADLSMESTAAIFTAAANAPSVVMMPVASAGAALPGWFPWLAAAGSVPAAVRSCRGEKLAVFAELTRGLAQLTLPGGLDDWLDDAASGCG